MIKLNIVVVTRNRLLALIDALNSIKRIIEIQAYPVEISVTIQDNSDYEVQESILKYFRKTLLISYLKTNQVLSMSMNWNQGILRAVRKKGDYIVVLADRRLVSTNLINALAIIEQKRKDFICFDHQDTWVNALKVRTKNYTFDLQIGSHEKLLKAFGSAQIDWHNPMLFNCILRTDFLSYLGKHYGSFAEGSSPDMNFLARMVDLRIQSYLTYDAPCILTNARHVTSSNGNSFYKTNYKDNEHYRLSGIDAYPHYMANFVTANIIGSLERYWDTTRIKEIINPRNFLKSSLLELSYPKSLEIFCKMKESLYEFADEFSLDESDRRLIKSIQHTEVASQMYPIDTKPDLNNTPNLGLINQIERLMSK